MKPLIVVNEAATPVSNAGGAQRLAALAKDVACRCKIEPRLVHTGTIQGRRRNKVRTRDVAERAALTPPF